MSILSILLLFVASQAGACSSYTSIGACGADDACNWNPGKCNPFSAQDCTTSNCLVGCEYTPPGAGSCVNSAIAQCATGTSEDCGGVGSGDICGMTSGVCVAKQAVVTCPAEIENDANCPDGCEVGNDVPYCELPSASSPVNYCEGYSITPTFDSQCARSYLCQVSSSGSCIPSDGDADNFDICSPHNCSQDPNCKISGDECVPDLDKICSLLPTVRTSECENTGYCKVTGDNLCVELTPNEKCLTHSVVSRGSACENDILCKVSSGFCVFDSSVEIGEEDWCSWLELDFCSEESEGECKVSKGKCVSSSPSASNTSSYDEYCRSLSTTLITDCGSQSGCKVSGAQCVALTSDEICSTYSVTASYSACDLNDFCESNQFEQPDSNSTSKPDSVHLKAIRPVRLGEVATCVVRNGGSEYCNELTEDRCKNSYGYGCEWTSGACKSSYEELCSSLSTTKTVSNCQRNSEGKCALNSAGACVAHTPVAPDCKLNQGKNECNNPSSDGCWFYTKKSCKIVDCGVYSNQNDCEYSNADGCEWTTTETTSCKPVISCPTQVDGSCSSTDVSCQSTAATGGNCAVNPTVSTADMCNKATISECNGASGCKWNITDGGVCIQKTCADSPSFARCCSPQDANCAYCSGLSIPSDCPNFGGATSCANSPSYSTCCPGVDCTSFCTAFPSDSGCKSKGSGASHTFAPFVALLVALILL